MEYHSYYTLSLKPKLCYLIMIVYRIWKCELYSYMLHASFVPGHRTSLVASEWSYTCTLRMFKDMGH